MCSPRPTLQTNLRPNSSTPKQSKSSKPPHLFSLCVNLPSFLLTSVSVVPTGSVSLETPPSLSPFLFQMWPPIDDLVIFLHYCSSIYSAPRAARPSLFSPSYSRMPDLYPENRALITSLPPFILFCAGAEYTDDLDKVSPFTEVPRFPCSSILDTEGNCREATLLDWRFPLFLLLGKLS